MTSNQLKKLADSLELDLKYVTSWAPPQGEDMRPLIAMPNIPKPLHGRGMQPRTILRPSEWDAMRKACYEAADNTCEICGEKPENLRMRHCLERGTEVLTTSGWKTIEQVTTNDVVAGFNPETETIVWEHPTSTTSHFEKNIYRFGYKNGRGFSVGVSSGHRMLLQDGRTKRYITKEAKDVKPRQYKNIPSAGKGCGGERLSADERLLIALQADGTVSRRSKNSCFCQIRVKKQDKIKRLKKLAKESSYTTHQKIYKTPKYGEYFRLSFSIPYRGKNFFDTFQTPKMSYDKANDFIDELVKWDGWEGFRNGCRGRCYYTSEKQNIDFVQAVCAQAGLGSHLTVTHRKVRDFGDHVSIGLKPAYNLEIKKTAFYGMTTMNKKLEPYNDDVFCISLPSSYFVARTKGGDVFITGNCHEVFVIDYEKGTATFIGCFCVCYLDHIGAIHNGRCLTLWKDKNPLYPTEFLLAGAEKAFTIISSYNREHPEQEPVRLYSTWIEYLKHDELREPMLELIKKYDVSFYMEDPKKTAPWNQWRLIFDGKEYPTPYKNEKEWKEAMKEAGKNDTARIYGAKKKKFTSLDSVEITEENIKAIEQAEVPEEF